MSDTALTPEEEIRAIAVREANYFFAFTAREPANRGAQDAVFRPSPPPVGMTNVLEMADHIVRYIQTGEKPSREPDGA